MDEVRLKDGFMTRLSNELDRPVSQVIDGALLSVLRSYKISKRKTGLSTNTISFPELGTFIGKTGFEDYSVSAINQYQRFLTDLLIYIDKPVQGITGEGVMKRLNYYEQVKKISSSARDHKRRIASSSFTLLHERDYISEDPVSIMDPVEYVAEIREVLTGREIEKLRIVCGTNIRDNAILELFLVSGYRASEVVSMWVEDMDLQARCGKVLGKGRKKRMVFFNDRAMKYLEQYLGGHKSGAVILSKRVSYQELKKNVLENIIRKTARKAGLSRRVFPYLLRHTFTTRALNKGTPLPILYGLIGHSSIGTTRIYTKNGAGKIRYKYDIYATS